MAGQLTRRRSSIRDRQRGDAVIEFAMLAPILLLILFGILEVGRLVDAWIVVENAAREGARVGAETVGSAPDVAAQQAALNYLTGGLAPRGDVSSTAVPTPVVTSDSVQVTARANVQLYTPLFRALLPAPVPVSATASMRRQ
jgi:Flp pilus assembly protein TadG